MSPLFRRRRRGEDQGGPATDAPPGGHGSAAQEPEGAAPRGLRGPYDIDASHPAGHRIDLGALHIPAVQGTSLQVEVDTATRVARSASVLAGPSRITLTAFAAPRTAGIWADVRSEIVAAVKQAGGTARESDGDFGPELVTAIPATLPDGRQAMRVQRHVGVDGPRWFVRAVFSGPEVVAAAGISTPPGAVDPARTAALQEVLRGCVVVRGPGARPPREPLQLTLPTTAVAALEQPAGAGEPAAHAPGQAAPQAPEQAAPQAPEQAGPAVS